MLFDVNIGFFWHFLLFSFDVYVGLFCVYVGLFCTHIWRLPAALASALFDRHIDFLCTHIFLVYTYIRTFRSCCLTHTLVPFEIFVGLFWRVCRSLLHIRRSLLHTHVKTSWSRSCSLTYTKVPFDIFAGLFWRVSGSFLRICRFLLHTHIKIFRSTRFRVVWNIFRFLLTYV